MLSFLPFGRRPYLINSKQIWNITEIDLFWRGKIPDGCLFLRRKTIWYWVQVILEMFEFTERCFISDCRLWYSGKLETFLRLLLKLETTRDYWALFPHKKYLKKKKKEGFVEKCWVHNEISHLWVQTLVSCQIYAKSISDFET